MTHRIVGEKRAHDLPADRTRVSVCWVCSVWTRRTSFGKKASEASRRACGCTCEQQGSVSNSRHTLVQSSVLLRVFCAREKQGVSQRLSICVQVAVVYRCAGSRRTPARQAGVSVAAGGTIGEAHQRD